jgi:hypothetical protein
MFTDTVLDGVCVDVTVAGRDTVPAEAPPETIPQKSWRTEVAFAGSSAAQLKDGDMIRLMVLSRLVGVQTQVQLIPALHPTRFGITEPISEVH